MPKCSKCGEMGHNARTCGRAKDDDAAASEGAPPGAPATQEVPWETGRPYTVTAGEGRLQHLSFDFVPSTIDPSAPISVSTAASGLVSVERGARDGSAVPFRGQVAPQSDVDAALVFRDGAFEILPISRSIVKITHVRGDDECPVSTSTAPRPRKRALGSAKPARPAATQPKSLTYERVDESPRGRDDLVCRPVKRINAAPTAGN